MERAARLRVSLETVSRPDELAQPRLNLWLALSQIYLDAMLEEFADDDAKSREILLRIGRLNERLRRYDRAADTWIAYLNVAGLPPEDSQFLETKQFSVTEICRIFRVPPHMIGDLERATFSNIESQNISFAVHTIRPWLVRIEQAVNRALISENEKGRFYVQFNIDGEDYQTLNYLYRGLGVMPLYGSEDMELWREVEFDGSAAHKFRITMRDVQAKSLASYHLRLDYVEFIPIN